MGVRSFVDTNVLVYAFDDADPRKKERSLEIIRSGVDGNLVLSTQVLQEFYVAATRKLRTPLSAEVAEQAVTALARLPVVPVDAALVLAAIAACRRYQLSLWDALIVVAARASGCERLWTEDLQAGMRFDGLTVVNPYAP